MKKANIPLNIMPNAIIHSRSIVQVSVSQDAILHHACVVDLVDQKVRQVDQGQGQN